MKPWKKLRMDCGVCAFHAVFLVGEETGLHPSQIFVQNDDPKDDAD